MTMTSVVQRARRPSSVALLAALGLGVGLAATFWTTGLVKGEFVARWQEEIVGSRRGSRCSSAPPWWSCLWVPLGVRHPLHLGARAEHAGATAGVGRVRSWGGPPLSRRRGDSRPCGWWPLGLAQHG